VSQFRRVSVVQPFGFRYAYLNQFPLALPGRLYLGSPPDSQPVCAVESHQKAPSLVLSSTSKSIDPESSRMNTTFGLTALLLPTGTEAMSVVAAAAAPASESSAARTTAGTCSVSVRMLGSWRSDGRARYPCYRVTTDCTNDSAFFGPRTRTVTR